MIWTYEQIAALAPDTATLQRARGISFARYKWQLLEGNEQLIWGQYEGGGNQVYRVAVQLQNQSFFCTCRSARKPCKHALGLALILQKHNESFRVTYDPPAWVRDWLQERPAPARRPPQVSSEPADQRLHLMEAGLLDLERWLLDLAEQGLASVGNRGNAFLDELASRMVDAKLGGLARRLRLLKQHFGKDGWQDLLARELGDLYLLAQGFKRLDQLPPTLRKTLLHTAGVNIRKEEVLQEKPVNDRWLILGHREGTEENLSFRRTWLAGEKSGKTALLLDFAWGQTGYAEQWPPGRVIQASLAYYPLHFPMRAQIGDFSFSSGPFAGQAGHPHWEAFTADLAAMAASDPWAPVFPAMVDQITPLWQENALVLADNNRKTLRIPPDDPAGWKLLALSGGNPVRIFGEWDGAQFFLLSAIYQGRFVFLRQQT